ncbi:hypothetical protein KUTeg_002697 [Tegillarca granosa]|uniref:Peptidase M13 N-terminal domain-containing protein n=1 Tax=Tegillarca granosa TaxID=220873 RepID=A0ABQ9FV55_TEGGR|nr:hypothetical protein KUTeg_002697 [Tegillarca granosa]
MVCICELAQPGFGMPSADYLLQGRDDRIVKAYEKLAITIAVELGADKMTAKSDIRDIVDFETAVANVRKITVPSLYRRDNEKLYNKFTLGHLVKESVISMRYRLLQSKQQSSPVGISDLSTSRSNITMLLAFHYQHQNSASLHQTIEFETLKSKVLSRKTQILIT